MDNHLLRYNKTKKIVIFDFETENLCLNFRYNLPWQFAVQVVQGDQLCCAENYYIKWDRPLNVGADAARITHYDKEFVQAHALEYTQVYPRMRELFESCDHILGHNILGFDTYLIKEWFEKMGHPWQHLMDKLIDTHCVAKGIKMQLFYKPEDNFLEYMYKLLHLKAEGVKTALKYLGPEMEIEHDYEHLHQAEVDIDLNRKVWNKLKFQLEL